MSCCIPTVKISSCLNRHLKKLLAERAGCKEAFGGIYFIYRRRKWRSKTQELGLEFDNFKPLLKSGIHIQVLFERFSIFSLPESKLGLTWGQRKKNHLHINSPFHHFNERLRKLWWSPKKRTLYPQDAFEDPAYKQMFEIVKFLRL
jgi:hypothetical protein